MAVGTPLGLQATVTAGIISAKSRNNLDLARIEDFIQTDAAINRGNSGGPMVNMAGEVVGVNTAIVSNMGGNMGIGFAIPSNIAKNVMDQLMSTGSVSRSYIGIEMQQIDHNLAAALGLPRPEGALIAVVIKNSPAEKAGLKQGDVITKLNGSPVQSIGAFRTSIALMPPGSKIQLSLLRNGQPIEQTVETEKFASVVAKKEEISTHEHRLGISVMNLSPETAQKLGYHSDGGVVVAQVENGSIGQLAGLKKGILIMSINQNKIENVDQFNKILKESDKAKPLLLLVGDGKTVRFIPLKID